MIAAHLAGEDWTSLVGISAYGDDRIHLSIEKLVHVRRGMLGYIDPDFLHNLNRFRVNITDRSRACAMDVDKVSRSSLKAPSAM